MGVAVASAWDYNASCETYHAATEKLLARSSTYILCGYGASVKLSGRALCLIPGSPHGASSEPMLFYKGAHSLKRLIITSSDGHLSLAALEWCAEEGITILMLGFDGEPLYSMLPGMRYDTTLRRRQYGLSEREKLAIAKALVEEKTQAQIETIEKHPELHKRSDALRALARGAYALSEVPDIEALRQVEASMAARYFASFMGIPLSWATSDKKRVPPHWRRITARNSLLAPNGNARHATNPFHAALNYLYTVVEHDILAELHTRGVDASVGLLHAEQAGKPVLCYDLVEPLRGITEDYALSHFGKLTLTLGDVSMTRDGRVLFNPEFLRYLLAACALPSRATSDVVDTFVSRLRGATSG